MNGIGVVCAGGRIWVIAALQIKTLELRFMADQPPTTPDDRFKAEMPAIPGVANGPKPSSNAVAPLKIVGGNLVFELPIYRWQEIQDSLRRLDAARTLTKE